MPPRSSATTLMPASVNSFASIPPVQPRPTNTTSTSLSIFAMVALRSTHIRDAGRLAGEFLVLEIDDVLLIHLDHARETQHLPASLVFVATVDRVGEHPFNHGLIDDGKKTPPGRPFLNKEFPAV